MKPIRILLVEDYLPDVRLTQRAFQKASVPNILHTAIDGVEAMEFLRKGGDTPDFVLLDLNMPRKDGRAVLQEMRSEEGLRHIPVIMLTTSKLDLDIRESYRLGANAYVVKPVSFESFRGAVATIENFWMALASLP